MVYAVVRRICMFAFVLFLGSLLNTVPAYAFISTSDYYSLWSKLNQGPGVVNTNPPAAQNPANNPATPDSTGTQTSPQQPAYSGSGYTTSKDTTRSDYYSRLLNSRNNYYRYNPQPATPGNTGNQNPGTDTTSPGNTGTNPGGNTGTTPPGNNTGNTPGGNTGTTPPPTTGTGDTGSVTAAEKQMLDLVNQERIKAGLPAFRVDSRLVELARMKSRDMYENNYFSHTSPTYGSPYDMERKAGISYRVLGAENIAKASSVTRAHQLLMNSDGHRANILDPRHDTIGIGIASTSGGIYVTQLFAGN